jgi:hypothetical protein
MNEPIQNIDHTRTKGTKKTGNSASDSGLNRQTLPDNSRLGSVKSFTECYIQ